MTSSATSIKPRSQAAITASAEGTVLVVTGDVDDHTRLVALADQLGKQAIIDLGGVGFINSVGVREWITLLEALDQKGATVVLRNVSEPMVRQMTMVMEARGAAAVESFYAPYVCPGCGDERSLLIAVEPHRAELAAGTPPKQACPDCGAAMDFDEFPRRYLSFLG